MSEYRRFIAYIYEYRNGKKEKNAGFVKAEVRNGLCRLWIQLQTGSQETQILDCYGVVRRQRQILGIRMGTGQLKQGRMELRLTVPEQTALQPFGQPAGQSVRQPMKQSAEQKIGETVRFAELSGLWIQGENRLFLTVWDEEPVDVSMFSEFSVSAGEEKPDECQPKEGKEEIREEGREENRQEEREKNGEEIRKEGAKESGEKNRKEEGEKTREDIWKESGKENGEKDRREEREKTREEIRKESGEKNRRGIQEESGKEYGEENREKSGKDGREGNNRKSRDENGKNSGEDEREGNNKENRSKNREGTGTDTCMESLLEKEKGQSAPAEAPELIADAELRVSQSEEDVKESSLASRWQQFQYHYPKEYPFEDDEIPECLRIAMKDLDYLGPKGRIWCASPFVQQRYLKYRHLILGRHENGRFLLGVPGLNRNVQDVHLAAMYGFPEFKSGGDGSFGYWYRFL